MEKLVEWLYDISVDAVVIVGHVWGNYQSGHPPAFQVQLFSVRLWNQDVFLTVHDKSGTPDPLDRLQIIESLSDQK